MGIDARTRKRLGQRLQAVLAEKSLSQDGLAKQLGVQQATVCRWIGGTRRPNPLLRDRLEMLTGIPASDWLSEREKRWSSGSRA